MTKREPKEGEIQAAICDYLAHKGHFFWRQNNGGMYREGRFFALPKYGMTGIPDIIVIKDGWFVGLEVKRPKSTLSAAQREFRDKCKEAGGEYYRVTSIDDVQEIGL